MGEMLLEVLMVLMLFYMGSPAFAASTIAITSDTTGTRKFSSTGNSYTIDIVMTDTGSDKIYCDLAISSDDIPDNNDYWTNGDNNRCVPDNCPATSVVTFTQQGPVYDATFTGTDTTNQNAIYAIIMCDYDNLYKCSYAAKDSPQCFAGSTYYALYFPFNATQSEVPVSFSNITIIGLQPVQVGQSLSFSAYTDGTNANYSWTFSDSSTTLSGEKVSYAFNTNGEVKVAVNVTNQLGFASSSVTVTVQSPGSSPTSGNSATGTPTSGSGADSGAGSGSNAGLVAGVVIAVLVVLLALLVLGFLYYRRRQQQEGKNSRSISAAKLTHTTEVPGANISTPVKSAQQQENPMFAAPRNQQAQYNAENTQSVIQVNDEDLGWNTPPPATFSPQIESVNLDTPSAPFPVFTGNINELAEKINAVVLPPIVWQSYEYIQKKGLDTEGIFRIPGSQTEIKELKTAFEKGQMVDLMQVKDPLTVAGLLKSHFREGKEENVPKRIYPLLYAARNDPSALRSVILCEMTPTQISTIRQMCYLFVLVEAQSERNLMHADNLAKVFGPSLFRDMPIDSANPVMAALIKNYATIFNF